jgi:hypothetical protein
MRRAAAPKVRTKKLIRHVTLLRQCPARPQSHISRPVETSVALHVTALLGVCYNITDDKSRKRVRSEWVSSEVVY